MMTSNITVMKNALRQDIKKTLSLMSTEEKSSQSNYVTDKLLQHQKYLLATRIGIYLSLPDEIQTDNILKHMFGVGKICFIPRYNSDSMQMIRLNSFEEKNTLPKTKWNIPQPSENDIREEALHSGGLDLLIVPGRAFTKNGYRLGRGKGYYDKYLNDYFVKNNKELPYTIGLAFSQQIVDELPTTPEDFTLNEVICPENV
ncbi:5-formyltetrahydrofolate cyclo-ligase isoform X2 [Planococcus citri]